MTEAYKNNNHLTMGNQPTILKDSRHMRTQRARELAGVGEDSGGGGKGGMKPIPSMKPVGRHNNDDDRKKLQSANDSGSSRVGADVLGNRGVGE